MLDTTLPPATQPESDDSALRAPVRRLAALAAVLAVLGFVVARGVVDLDAAIWMLAAVATITGLSYLFDRLEHH